ncbi:MAG: DUF2169 domain-containing protein [Desulfobacterales bacterium]|nr:DUF2169 domain-containing protein [Desulfobacterales bacterium]
MELEDHPDIKCLLVQDSDIYPFKPATDVVIKGHAYGSGRTIFEAAVRVHGSEKRILVIGDRRCALNSRGGLGLFRPGRRVDKVPLAYTHAYGGRDKVAEKKYGNPFLELHPGVDKRHCDMDMASPFLYPRNPCGRGYPHGAGAGGRGGRGTAQPGRPRRSAHPGKTPGARPPAVDPHALAPGHGLV